MKKKTRIVSEVHKECRSPKYRMRIERKRKGRGSFKRSKKVEE